MLHAGQGSLLDVRGPSGRAVALRVSGLAIDRGIAPGSMEGLGYAYGNRATLDRLGAGDQLDEVRVTIASNEASEVAAIVADAASSLAAAGRAPRRVAIERRRHFHEDEIREGTRALECVSLLVLLLAAAIGFNVLSALMARQRREVGIMKAIGGEPGTGAPSLRSPRPRRRGRCRHRGDVRRRCRRARVRRVHRRTAQRRNPRRLDPASVVALEIGGGLAVPLAGGLLPIALAADRRVVGGPKRLSTPAALRDHPRRPRARRRDLHDGPLRRREPPPRGRRRARDTWRRHSDPPCWACTRGDARDARAEAWSYGRVALHLREPAVGSEPYDLFAPPDDTTILRASPLEGRWPKAQEDDAIVINGAFRARASSTLAVGSRLRLLAEGQSYELRVVGVVSELADAALYTNTRTFARLFGRERQANALRVATRDEPDTAVAQRLEGALIDAGAIPTFVMTRSTYRELLVAHMGEVFGIFLIAALATVTLGALSLSASIGLSALERRRELGVLRALGASFADVARVMILAGAIVGASLVLALAASVPMAIAMNQWMSEGLYVGIPLAVAPEAIATWMVIAAAVTLAASAIPMMQAMRVPVHEAIGYE